jgi:hypothetical protein
METSTCSTALSLADQLRLDDIARKVEDPNIPTQRLLEMLSELTLMDKRYKRDFSVRDDWN